MESQVLKDLAREISNLHDNLLLPVSQQKSMNHLKLMFESDDDGPGELDRKLEHLPLPCI